MPLWKQSTTSVCIEAISACLKLLRAQMRPNYLLDFIKRVCGVSCCEKHQSLKESLSLTEFPESGFLGVSPRAYRRFLEKAATWASFPRGGTESHAFG